MNIIFGCLKKRTAVSTRLIENAVGSGKKTSSCQYPYTSHLLSQISVDPNAAVQDLFYNALSDFPAP